MNLSHQHRVYIKSTFDRTSSLNHSMNLIYLLRYLHMRLILLISFRFC